MENDTLKQIGIKDLLRQLRKDEELKIKSTPLDNSSDKEDLFDEPSDNIDKMLEISKNMLYDYYFNVLKNIINNEFKIEVKYRINPIALGVMYLEDSIVVSIEKDSKLIEINEFTIFDKNQNTNKSKLLLINKINEFQFIGKDDDIEDFIKNTRKIVI